MRIRRVGVVGAGTMGSGIAALVASVGIPVVLLDVPGTGQRLEVVQRGLRRALEARPPAFYDPARAALITLGTIDDDLSRLAECDWIVEAIIEQPEPKQALFAKLESIVHPKAIVSSNTSGIPIHILAEGRGEAFRRRFLGTHFFNPPRYLHLLEIIPLPETDPEVVETMAHFADYILGKGVVRAKDTPGFIANRLGVYGMVQALRLMEQFDLTVDEVDGLTGPLLGRPRSATFRTTDLTGLDILQHVAGELGATTGDDFALPDWVHEMARQGRLGEKTGAGFYRREGRAIFTLDWKTGEYRPRQELATPEVKALLRQPLPERLRGALQLPGNYGPFLRALLARTFHYTLMRAPEIAYDLVDIDRALEWGFGWELGPFATMDALGLDTVRHLLGEHGLDEPPLLQQAGPAFYQRQNGTRLVLTLDGGRKPVTPPPGQLSLRFIKEEQRELLASPDAALLDLGDGVVLLEFRSKQNTLGDGVLTMIERTIDFIVERGYAGLVIGNEDPRVFSAGANLVEILTLAKAGQWDMLDQAVRRFQRMTTGLRDAPFPVVVAAFGMTLGGGAEMALYADHVQAAAELAIGLVETGVGLIPAGGGTTALLRRFSEELQPYEQADPFEAVRRAFNLIAFARVSGSAFEARSLGYLRPSDGITINRDRLIADAKARVLLLAPSYVPPVPGPIQVLGNEALGNLRYAIWAAREANQISEHDAFIGEQLALILSGGEGPARTVPEQTVLDLEREAFLRLLGTAKTQERIVYMLENGKPLRN
ncbi:MAG: enoyl-CoA hydratase/isomerase family protein [Thermorudis peleae]|nr:enoyl-CoA hydratase/isomerase family protein [Thermorudis peleae]